MITSQQIRARVHGMYTPMVRRFGPKVWHTGKRAGKLRTPGQEVPFTEPELRDWVLVVLGFNARPCPYCGAPIDALSFSLDHDIPVSRGGSLGFSNLVAMCKDCNRLKGGLTGAEFAQLLGFLNGIEPGAQKDLVQRLRSGAMGTRLRFMSRPKTVAAVDVEDF